MVNFDLHKKEYLAALEKVEKHLDMVFAKSVSDKYDYYDTIERFSELLKINKNLQQDIRSEFTKRGLI